MEGSDAELLAADGDVLGSQHGGVGGGLVTVGLDLHATGNTGDGLTAAGITQVSLCTIFFFQICQIAGSSFEFADPRRVLVQTYERSVTWTKVSLKEAKIRATPKTSSPGGTCCQRMVLGAVLTLAGVSRFWRFLPSRTWGPREMFS